MPTDGYGRKNMNSDKPYVYFKDKNAHQSG